MSRKTIITILILLISGLLIESMIFGSGRPPQKPPEERIAPLVEAYAVSLAPTAAVVSAQGTVQPARNIDVVSRVSGVIQEISPHFNNGQYFEAQEMLVQIEKTDYEIALTRARASLADAERQLAQEEGQSRQAAREWRDLGDERANNLALRKPQLEAARANLVAQRANVRQAELDLERTTIKVPFNALISEKFVEIGQYVAPGQRVAHIYGTDEQHIRVPLTDRQVRLINLPDQGDRNYAVPVRVRGTFGTHTYEWQGNLKRVEASLNVSSQTVYAVIEVSDPVSITDQRTILPVGLFVETDIEGEIIDGAISLPRAALKPGNVIYAIRDGKLEFVEAELLKSDLETVLVLADLNDGDMVALDHMRYAVPGMSVRIRGVDDVEPEDANTEAATLTAEVAQ